MIYPRSRTKFRDIVDGTAFTAVVCESKEENWSAWADGVTAATYALTMVPPSTSRSEPDALTFPLLPSGPPPETNGSFVRRQPGSFWDVDTVANPGVRTTLNLGPVPSGLTMYTEENLPFEVNPEEADGADQD